MAIWDLLRGRMRGRAVNDEVADGDEAPDDAEPMDELAGSSPMIEPRPALRTESWLGGLDSGRTVGADPQEDVKASYERLARDMQSLGFEVAELSRRLSEALDGTRTPPEREPSPEGTMNAIGAEWIRAIARLVGMTGMTLDLAPGEWILLAAVNQWFERPGENQDLTRLLEMLRNLGVSARVVQVSCDGDRYRVVPHSGFPHEENEHPRWLLHRLEERTALLVPLDLRARDRADGTEELAGTYRGARSALTLLKQRVDRACRLEPIEQEPDLHRIADQGSFVTETTSFGEVLPAPGWEARPAWFGSPEAPVDSREVPMPAPSASPGPDPSTLAAQVQEGLDWTRKELSHLGRQVEEGQAALKQVRADLARTKAELQGASERLRTEAERSNVDAPPAEAARDEQPERDGTRQIVHELQNEVVVLAKQTQETREIADDLQRALESVRVRLGQLTDEVARWSARSPAPDVLRPASPPEPAIPPPSPAPDPAVRVAPPTAESRSEIPPETPVESQIPSMPNRWWGAVQLASQRCGAQRPEESEETFYLRRVASLLDSLEQACKVDAGNYSASAVHAKIQGQSIGLHRVKPGEAGAAPWSCENCGLLTGVAYQILVNVRRDETGESALLAPLGPYVFGRHSKAWSLLLGRSVIGSGGIQAIRLPATLARDERSPGGFRVVHQMEATIEWN